MFIIVRTSLIFIHISSGISSTLIVFPDIMLCNIFIALDFCISSNSLILSIISIHSFIDLNHLEVANTLVELNHLFINHCFSKKYNAVLTFVSSVSLFFSRSSKLLFNRALLANSFAETLINPLLFFSK